MERSKQTETTCVVQLSPSPSVHKRCLRTRAHVICSQENIFGDGGAGHGNSASSHNISGMFGRGEWSPTFTDVRDGFVEHDRRW